MKVKKNVTSNVSCRTNVVMPNRQMQEVGNVRHATHTNTTNNNNMAAYGECKDMYTDAVVEANMSKGHKMNGVGSIGEPHVFSHKFQASNKTEEVSKGNTLTTFQIGVNVPHMICIEDDERSNETKKLPTKEAIEIVDEECRPHGEEDDSCHVTKTAKTKGECKKQLTTVFKLKAEKEHLLKKVQQIIEDKNQEQKLLTDELAFYKRYYKEKEACIQRGKIIMENFKRQDEEKKKMEEAKKKENKIEQEEAKQKKCNAEVKSTIPNNTYDCTESEAMDDNGKRGQQSRADIDVINQEPVNVATVNRQETSVINYDDHTYDKQQSRRKKGLPVCVICRTKCANKAELAKHIERYHKRSSSNSCPHCYENCKTKKSLNNHIDKKHYDIKKNTKRNICVVCGIKFDTERQYKKHVSEAHTKTKGEILHERTITVRTKQDEPRHELKYKIETTSTVLVHSDNAEEKAYHKDGTSTAISQNECEMKDKEKSVIGKEKKGKKEMDGDNKSSDIKCNKDVSEDKVEKCLISSSDGEHLKRKDRLGKHLCKKCGIYFHTARILTTHINKFHKFTNSEEDDDDLQVVYDDNEKPSCVKKFQTEINDNICAKCGLKFLTGKMLKKHNEKHHVDETEVVGKKRKLQHNAGQSGKNEEVGMDVKCVKCAQSFMTKDHLKIHMIDVHQKDTKYKKRKYEMVSKVTSWECNQCSKKFKMHSKLLSHMSTHQVYRKKEHVEPSTSKPHGTYCVTCSRNFSTKGELQRHYQEEHESKKSKCSKCPKSFSSKYSLKQHYKVEHEGKRYKCTESECKEEFKRKDQRDFHVMKHKGQSKFQCPVCKMGFFQKHHFQGHLNSHGNQRPNWCPKCGKQFIYSQDVYKHLDKCGVVEKEYECTMGDCKSKRFFASERDLERHAKSYHRLGDPIVCDMCGFSTYYHQSYKLHLKSHEGDN